MASHALPVGAQLTEGELGVDVVALGSEGRAAQAHSFVVGVGGVLEGEGRMALPLDGVFVGGDGAAVDGVKGEGRQGEG